MNLDLSKILLLLLVPVPPPCSALDNGLGRTPPLGFNPWNCFGMGRSGSCKLVNPSLPPPGCHDFNETVILDIADAMVTSGLRGAGYEYVNLDCGWTTGYRNKTTNNLIVNRDKFPHGLKWLGDELHKKGLKFGVYLSASKVQCCHKLFEGANDGSYGFEKQDADLIASYGADYLKYDACGQVNESYYRMRDALNSTGRHIFYSVHGLAGAQAVRVANAWRTTSDISNTFDSVLDRALQNDAFAPFSGPGSFAMPDMLEVGNFFNVDASLSNAESRSMMSMWAAMKAPLLIGTDLTLPRGPDDETIEILGHREVLAIDQDPSGQSARLVAGTPDDTAVYAGTLSGGGGGSSIRRVLSLTNSGNATSVDITLNLDQVLGKPGWAWRARDVWKGGDYMHKTVSGRTTFKNIGRHDTLLLTLTGLPPPSSSREREVMPSPSPSSVVLQSRSSGRRFRIQALSCTFVRIELENKDGSFEDRPTFLVQNRSWAGIPLNASSDKTSAHTRCYSVSVGGTGASALELRDASGTVVWQGASLAEVSSAPAMPEPADMFGVWAVNDRPRFAVPLQGAVPSGIGGFDFSAEVDDAYFFVAPASPAAASRYGVLRRDFLALTGAVPLLPDFVMGLWFTWYHNYTASAKLREIDDFKTRGFKLDVASLDMDWRLHPCYVNSLTPNCSDTPPETEAHYVVNTGLIPDMAGFLTAAHERGVKVFFNDHPMTPTVPAGVNFTETSPAEIRFRYDGLTSLLKDGLDFWWFDCHWHQLTPGIQCQGKDLNCKDGVDYATWGQYVFWSVMKQFSSQRGDAKRTIMLGCSSPSNRALHRTPVHWTGDNHYDELAKGIQQTVDGGVNLRPWIHQDCGAHHGPGSVLEPLEYPPEVYVRWIQYCSASNVARLHSDPALSRLPWEFGDEAEAIAKQFFAMRQALRPTLVAAARRTHDEGLPVVRRCDLEWPELATEGAADSQQYLLADDLLVRPVDPFVGILIVNKTTRTYAPSGGKWNRDTTVWLPPGEWHDAFTGETHAGNQNVTMRDVPQNRMPMFHRGGGMVITTSAEATEPDRTGASIGVHIWPTRASCGGIGGGVGGTGSETTRPTVRREIYAPSELDAAGSMAPWSATKRELADGSGFDLDIRAGDFDFDIEEEEYESVESSAWTLYVHLPAGVGPNATALHCGSGAIAVQTELLGHGDGTRAVVAPFSSRRVTVLPLANSIVEAKIDLSSMVPGRRLGGSGNDRTRSLLRCRFACRRPVQGVAEDDDDDEEEKGGGARTPSLP